MDHDHPTTATGRETEGERGPAPIEEAESPKPLFRGRHPRLILNEIRWRGLDLSLAQVEILHRGAPDDTIRVRADQIIQGRSFFRLGEAEIPYHRIKKIVYAGHTIYSREQALPGVREGGRPLTHPGP